MNKSTDHPDDDRLAALKDRIKASSAAARGERNTGYDTLLFLNTRYESLPTSVQHEQTLSPAAKTVFNNLWIFAKNAGAGASSTLFPDYDWLMRACSMSRGSVASSMTQLRLMRFITLHQKLRNEHHQFVGNDYILNDEPMAMADTLLLDADFVEFVRKARNHRHKRVCQLAKMTWASLNQHLESPDLLRPQTQIEKIEARQQAQMIIQKRLFPELVDENSPQPESYYGIPVEAYEAALKRVSQLPDEEDPPRVHKVNAALESRVHNVNAAPKPQVHNVNSGLEEGQVHFVNAGKTASELQVHNVNSEVNADMNAEVNSSSSSIYKTTTTTDTEFTEETAQATGAIADNLVFPEFEFPNERQLIEMLLAKLPMEHQQAMLDELAGRMEDSNMEPIRNVVMFFRSMIRKFNDGSFNFTSYSSRKARERNQPAAQDKASGQDRLIRMRELQSEVTSLNRLIEMNASGSAEDRQALIQQRDQLQQELDELTMQQAVG